MTGGGTRDGERDAERDGAVAPAKVNLSLRVVGRRPDGYHDLDGVMARLTLADALTCSDRADDDAIERDTLERVVGGDAWLDAQPIPLGESNLVLAAARAYRRAAAATGVDVPPLRWRLTKRVPIAAGLGGGSSDAAAALRILATRHPADLDLAALAAGLGSDVPFFVQRAHAARARGRGERLDAMHVPPQPVVLVNPGVAISAAQAYGWWTAGRSSVAATAPWWRGPAIVNDLEPGVAERVPEVGELLETMRVAHDGPVAMSGSGATCFALTRDEHAAFELADRLRSRLPDGSWVAVTALSAGS